MTHAIFLTFDDHHFGYAKMCLKSLEQNYPTHPKILAYYNGTTAKVFRFLETINNIKVLPCNMDFLNLADISLGVINSTQIFFRYILWTNEFENYDTILHLDADVVVLKPLDALFSKDEFFAVCDFSPFYSVFKNEYFQNQLLTNLLLNDDIELGNYPHNMMNAGVFVIPRSYRNKERFDRLWEITNKYNDFMMFADQSAISLWCHSYNIRFSKDIRFNFQCCFFHYPIIFYSELSNIELLNDVHILHFARYKPDSLFYKNLLAYCQSFIEISEKYKLDLD